MGRKQSREQHSDSLLQHDQRQIKVRLLIVKNLVPRTQNFQGRERDNIAFLTPDIMVESGERGGSGSLCGACKVSQDRTMVWNSRRGTNTNQFQLTFASNRQPATLYWLTTDHACIPVRV